MYSPTLGEPKDDLVSIFRRMLDLGTPEYEHELAEFLHNGPPKMRYEYIKEEDKWIDQRTQLQKRGKHEYSKNKERKKKDVPELQTKSKH